MTNLRIFYYSFFMLCAFLSLTIQAQFKNIKIDEALGTLGPCEPSIAISPANPDKIVAGAVLDRVYHSTDGGETWKSAILQSEYGVWGDPCIVANAKGDFFYFHLSNPEKNGWSSERLLDRIVCQKSGDGGESWNTGSFTGLDHPKDQDKEWATANLQNNALYLTWTQFDLYNSTSPDDSTNILFATSANSGDTWSNPLRINELAGNCLDDDLAVEGATPTVGPNGEIYVAWSRGNRIYFDRSVDSGKSWLQNDKKVVQQKAGWNIKIPGIGRANAMPVTGCDISNGIYNGRIYINYADQKVENENTDIWLVSSDDGGESWSSPIRVNDDSTETHQFFHWLAVDPVTGYLYVVFYDRRNFTDNQTDVYLAYSTDGGKHFTNVKISESPFTPKNDVFFGDYNNISAYNGKVRPIWTRQEGRKLSIWTALIDFVD